MKSLLLLGWVAQMLMSQAQVQTSVVVPAFEPLAGVEDLQRPPVIPSDWKALPPVTIEDTFQILFTNASEPVLLEITDEGFLFRVWRAKQWQGFDGTITPTFVRASGSGPLKNVEFFIQENSLYGVWEQGGHIYSFDWYIGDDAVTIPQKITSQLRASNYDPSLAVDSLGNLYVAWKYDKTEDIPNSFHTPSLQHHDLYLAKFDSGVLKIANVSQSFPSPVGIGKIDLLLTTDDQIVLAWSRGEEKSLGYRIYGENVMLTTFRDGKWSGWSQQEHPYQTYTFPGIHFEKPELFWDNQKLIIGGQAQFIEADETPNASSYQPAFFHISTTDAPLSIAPAHLVSGKIEKYRIFSYNKQPLLVENDPDQKTWIARRLHNGLWHQLNNHFDSSPYQTLLPFNGLNKDTLSRIWIAPDHKAYATTRSESQVGVSEFQYLLDK